MNGSEFELRRRAVELAGAGKGLSEIGRELGRSREWVRKWVARYAREGETGLEDRSRRPRSSPGRLSGSTVAAILSMRDDLEADRHANVGPEAVYAELERQALVEVVPSVSSIKRVLAGAGRSRPYQTRRRSSTRVWALPKVTVPGVWQQSDWVQDRRLEGGITFSSLQISDVGSDYISAGPHPRRTMRAAVRQLTRQAWPNMSIPLAMGTDNAFSKTTHIHRPWTAWIRLLLMFGVEPIVSPPHSLGFTNHVEAVNGLWQDRTIYRYRYHSLDDLTVDTLVFLDWANTRRAVLDPTICGTRYPADYVAAFAPHLRWLPTGFDIDDYYDRSGQCQIPLTTGRVTFLRHVRPAHTIEIANSTWPAPTSLPTGALIVATINTGEAHLELRHQGELLAVHPYPLAPATIGPYHPTAPHGLLDHLPGPPPTMS